MTSLIPLAPIHQIKPGKTMPFKVETELVLGANINNQYFAIKYRCSHEGSELSLGCLKDELSDFTLHGSRFNIITGGPIEELATEAVRSVPNVIINKTIQID
jgi:3-phenylpropionate/trans-cinnamate dioxygenase ferredoxin component